MFGCHLYMVVGVSVLHGVITVMILIGKQNILSDHSFH
jgi:hypothetical protein